MKYNRLGSSGLKISEISIGTWMTKGIKDKESFNEIINKSMDLGINSFDTANVYGKGQGEALLGNALKDKKRSDFVVSSKVFWPVGGGPNDYGLSRKHIIEQCDNSLMRLGLDYIDIYYFHRFDKETPVFESLKAMDDLIRSGKVLYCGISEWTLEELIEAKEIIEKYHFDNIIVNQVAYNLLNRNIEKFIATPYFEDIGVIAYSPLAQGVLTGKYNLNQEPPNKSRAAIIGNSSFYWYHNRRNIEIAEKLNHLSDNIGTTNSILSLAWVLKNRSISSALIGVSNIRQLEENVKACELNIPNDLLLELNQLSDNAMFNVK